METTDGGSTDLGALIQGLHKDNGGKLIFVSSIVKPDGTPMMTAHESQSGAQGLLEMMAEVWGVDVMDLRQDVMPLPLLL